MMTLDLTDEETTALVRLLTEAIEGARALNRTRLSGRLRLGHGAKGLKNAKNSGRPR
jgi:hypothetical protein